MRNRSQPDLVHGGVSCRSISDCGIGPTVTNNQTGPNHFSVGGIIILLVMLVFGYQESFQKRNQNLGVVAQYSQITSKY